MSSYFLSQEFQHVAQVCERQQYPPQVELLRSFAALKSTVLVPAVDLLGLLRAGSYRPRTCERLAPSTTAKRPDKTHEGIWGGNRCL